MRRGNRSRRQKEKLWPLAAILLVAVVVILISGYFEFEPIEDMMDSAPEAIVDRRWQHL